MFDSSLWSPESVAIVAAVLLLAGFVKGVVGLGLPTVSLGLLTAVFGLKAAIALMLVPSFATNIVQGLTGGALKEIFGRLWFLLAVASVAIWLFSALLAGGDTAILSAILGLSLCLYGRLSLTRPQVQAPGDKEQWLSPLIGAINGGLTGLTGSFVVPGVLYLQALGWPATFLFRQWACCSPFQPICARYFHDRPRSAVRGSWAALFSRFGAGVYRYVYRSESAQTAV